MKTMVPHRPTLRPVDIAAKPALFTRQGALIRPASFRRVSASCSVRLSEASAQTFPFAIRFDVPSRSNAAKDLVAVPSLVDTFGMVKQQKWRDQPYAERLRRSLERWPVENLANGIPDAPTLGRLVDPSGLLWVYRRRLVIQLHGNSPLLQLR